MSENNVTPLPLSTEQKFIAELSNHLPDNYSYCPASGLIIHTEFKQTEKGYKEIVTPVCSPLAVTSLTKSFNNENGGLVVEYVDRLGNLRRWVMPQWFLAEDFKVIGRKLHECLIPKLPVEAKGKTKFMELLQDSRPKKWITYTEKTGWHNGTFVFPEHIIGSNKDLIFQSTNPKHRKPVINGTVEEWQEYIGKYCVGNPTLMLGACAGFASALAGLLGIQGVILHTIGNSSTGKTITLGVFNSIMGQPKGSWKGTDNAKESEFEAQNHIGISLDEMGQAELRFLYHIVYMLVNGQGKARANQDGTAQRIREFNMFAMSTGELGLDDMLAKANMSLTGGLSVRCIQGKSDIFKYKCFDDIHGFNTPSNFADYLKDITCVDNADYNPKYAGAVGVEFIKYLATNVGDKEEFKGWIKEQISEISNKLTPVGADSQIKRMANSMAVVVMAGKLATQAGLTGWHKDDPFKDISRWWKECVLPTRGSVTSQESMNALTKIKDFFELHHMSHFTQLGVEGHQSQRSNANHYGYVGTENGETTFYVTSAGWRKICECKDTTSINYQCVKTGWMIEHIDSEGKSTQWKNKKINGKAVRCYWIKGNILES